LLTDHHAVQAEWGFVYKGSVIVSAVDEKGRSQSEKLSYGDIWYFPKGAAHTVQGLEDQNEYLLVFDDADFDRSGYVPSADRPMLEGVVVEESLSRSRCRGVGLRRLTNR
jgi:quercetin dioxygenase-like cupin family protein